MSIRTLRDRAPNSDWASQERRVVRVPSPAGIDARGHDLRTSTTQSRRCRVGERRPTLDPEVAALNESIVTPRKGVDPRILRVLQRCWAREPSPAERRELRRQAAIERRRLFIERRTARCRRQARALMREHDLRLARAIEREVDTALRELQQRHRRRRR